MFITSKNKNAQIDNKTTKIIIKSMKKFLLVKTN